MAGRVAFQSSLLFHAPYFQLRARYGNACCYTRVFPGNCHVRLAGLAHYGVVVPQIYIAAVLKLPRDPCNRLAGAQLIVPYSSPELPVSIEC